MPEYASDWQCPFCGAHSVITRERARAAMLYLDIDNSDGKKVAWARFVVCASPACRKFALYLSLHDAVFGAGPAPQPSLGKTINKWQLIPASSCKTFPAYIPKPILDDYQEACAILRLSPKSSATLARRALQGMIRDFWDVRKSRLIDEVRAIEEKVDRPVWDAIDAVRKLGNIGAHMEKDINLIVDVHPNEAQAMVALLEILLQEWYVARHERQRRLSDLKVLADAKEAFKKGSD
jgi:hypothetical protein